MQQNTFCIIIVTDENMTAYILHPHKYRQLPANLQDLQAKVHTLIIYR